MTRTRRSERPGRFASVRAVLRRIGLVSLAWLAAGCSSASPEPASPELKGAVKVPAADFPLERKEEPGLDPEGPVTHVGRSVLPRCHKMVVAKIAAVRSAGPGAEIVRIDETEILWGPPDPQSSYAVICGGTGLVPAPGGSALLLLRLLPDGAYEALEVAPLDDRDGPSRLEAFRKILAIEGAETADLRHASLLAYLRGAVASDDAWVRSNAVREYAAYADAFPGRLRQEDGAALARALPRVREPALRKLAQGALDRVPSASAATKKPTVPGGSSSSAAALDAFTKRFDAAKSDATERRRAVLEAAARLDRAAEPLIVRGLGDAEAVVREASAAAAGETGLAALVPRLVSLIVTDPSAQVRTTAVIALGHLRAAQAVETIAGLAQSDPALSREALFALARIRNDDATVRLRSLRDTAGPDRARLVDFLLSDEFVRQERAMGAKWAAEK